MSSSCFRTRLADLIGRQKALLERPNEIDDSWYNGVVDRYKHPVLTNAHTPLYWRFDLNEETNPLLIERLGVNAAFNPGAMFFDGKYCMMVRVEGIDRKSFFAVAESENGIDNFRYRDYPIVLPETDDPDTNVYDMRLVEHEDGWIYGMFCTERKDPNAPPGDESSAVAQCGLARTKNLDDWERLPDIRTSAPQQRNVVLHPEFVDGKYAFYTRPADEFISAGSKGGIGWGLCDDIENAAIPEETIMDPKVYHTIKEVKNGMGPAPLRTESGWLHILHGVRNTAAGLRYVLYAYLCDPDEPSRILHRPGGYLMAPVGEERIGDVSNVLFCNGAVMRDDGRIFIYYASSDTRVHVATSTVERMLDYVVNTPEDPLRSYACVQQRRALIAKNLELMRSGDPLLAKVL